ncbi:MAG: hypothetical protein EBQ56_01495 [Proteobacteria bacterium]|nr:hypothetical protein [Pseudomonadota bacterium]NCV23610.1 hypothetical protein [Chloroflexota bacterium]NBQ32855.1 hypothetical protein [Pseudomonadota bacterium]NBY46449.1 hypothetical protein [Pseudomonadota bacterium]NDB20978.1 hypothetical protein [Pseudomonadota bacterium]
MIPLPVRLRTPEANEGFADGEVTTCAFGITTPSVSEGGWSAIGDSTDRLPADHEISLPAGEITKIVVLILLHIFLRNDQRSFVDPLAIFTSKQYW